MEEKEILEVNEKICVEETVFSEIKKEKKPKVKGRKGFIVLLIFCVLIIAMLSATLILVLKDVQESKKESENLIFGEDLVPVKDDEEWGYINKKGEYVINPQFDDAYSFEEGLAVVKKGDEYGFIDKKGKYIINPKYEDAYNFYDGLAAVKKKGKWGFINKKGEVIIEFKYIDYVAAFTDDGYAVVVTEDKEYTLIDRNGNELDESFDAFNSYEETYCAVEDCCNLESYEKNGYCYDHQPEEETEVDYPYCAKAGCYKKAYYGDYCTDHNYLE